MPSARITALTLCLALLAGGCAYDGYSKIPGVYRIDIQQGNVVTQRMLEQLRPGMTPSQVRFIMGSPVLQDPFHPDRWDYLYSYSDSGDVRRQRLITLHFEEEQLAYVEGDVEPGEPREDLPPQSSRTVDVPKREFRQGFFQRLLNALPFVDQEQRRQQGPPTPEDAPPQDAEPLPPTVEDEVGDPDPLPGA